MQAVPAIQVFRTIAESIEDSDAGAPVLKTRDTHHHALQSGQRCVLRKISGHMQVPFRAQKKRGLLNAAEYWQPQAPQCPML